MTTKSPVYQEKIVQQTIGLYIYKIINFYYDQVETNHQAEIYT